VRQKYVLREFYYNNSEMACTILRVLFEVSWVTQLTHCHYFIQFSSSTSLMVLWSAHWQEIYSILLTDWSQLQTSWLIMMSLHPRMARVMASWGP
jgi:hypothetical protein